MQLWAGIHVFVASFDSPNSENVWSIKVFGKGFNTGKCFGVILKFLNENKWKNNHRNVLKQKYDFGVSSQVERSESFQQDKWLRKVDSSKKT